MFPRLSPAFLFLLIGALGNVWGAYLCFARERGPGSAAALTWFLVCYCTFPWRWIVNWLLSNVEVMAPWRRASLPLYSVTTFYVNGVELAVALPHWPLTLEAIQQQHPVMQEINAALGTPP